MTAVNDRFYAVETLRVDEGERLSLRAEIVALKQGLGLTGGFVVEVGSGLGVNLSLFRSDNRILGLEGLPDAAAEATAQGIPTQVIDFDKQDASWEGEASAVLCLDILEHLVYPARLLRCIRRGLGNQGCLIVNVPNHFNWRGRLKTLCGAGVANQKYLKGYREWDYPHLRFFSHSGIMALLQESGFRIVEDRSAMINSPKMRGFARRWPDMFCSGFLVVARTE